MWGAIHGYIGEHAAAIIISAIFSLAGLAAIVAWFAKTLKEIGELFTTVGTALADKNITKDELKDIIKEGKDVFNMFKKSPKKYKG